MKKHAKKLKASVGYGGLVVYRERDNRGDPAFGWKLSEEAKRDIAHMEWNARTAVARINARSARRSGR